MPDDTDIDLQPLLDAQQNKLGIIMNVGASIDSKALGLFGAIVAVLIFIAQLNLNIEWFVWVVLLGSLFLALGLTVVALYPRQYVSTSADLEKHPEFYAMPTEVLILQLLADTQYAIEQNGTYNRQRWRSCVGAFLATALGVLVLFVILLVQ
ncbi:MAG TPA: hypothetical protein VFT87_06010 [Candidatus Saccharimonadales bacterium]|nr:hypothetical protein [Candidatus Saccharimonadales bacterium]